MCQKWFYNDCGAVIKGPIQQTTPPVVTESVPRLTIAIVDSCKEKKTMHRTRLCGKTGGTLETMEEKFRGESRNRSNSISRTIHAQSRGDLNE